MPSHTLEDIGRIETFPTRQKIGNWVVRDMSYGIGKKKEGQRDVFHKGRLCMSAVIQHYLVMEFDFYGTTYRAVPDTLNLILDSFHVDIRVVDDNIRYGSKWRNIARSTELIILRRVP